MHVALRPRFSTWATPQKTPVEGSVVAQTETAPLPRRLPVEELRVGKAVLKADRFAKLPPLPPSCKGIPTPVHGAVRPDIVLAEYRFDRLLVQQHAVEGYDPDQGYWDGSGDIATLRAFYDDPATGWRRATRSELLRAFHWRPGDFAPWELTTTNPTTTTVPPTIDFAAWQKIAKADGLNEPQWRGTIPLRVISQHKPRGLQARAVERVVVLEFLGVSVRTCRNAIIDARAVFSRLPVTILVLVDRFRWTSEPTVWANAGGECLSTPDGVTVQVIETHEEYQGLGMLWHEIGHCMERGSPRVARSWALAMLLDGRNGPSGYSLSHWREDCAEGVRTYHEVGAAAYRDVYRYRATVIEAIVAGALSPLEPQLSA